MSDVIYPYPHTTEKTARAHDKARTKYFELRYALEKKNLTPAAKASLNRAMADTMRTLNRADAIAKRESKKYNAAQGPYEQGGFTPKSPSPNDLSKNRNQRPKSPSSSSLPRSAAGVKTTTKTVNKLYRPMGN
jgi:hypothetical protein